jgi:hypothetical protein
MMVPSVTSATSRPWRRQPVVAVLIAVLLTGAGLLSLTQSDALTATGRRIALLQDERSNLLEQRSEALLDFASATDPRALEVRAHDLGFEAPSTIAYVALSESASSNGLAWDARPSSPLAILRDAAQTTPHARRTPVGRLISLGDAAPPGAEAE